MADPNVLPIQLVGNAFEVDLKVLHISLQGPAAVFATTAAAGIGAYAIYKLLNNERYMRDILYTFRDLGGVIGAWRGGSLVTEIMSENEEVANRIREACESGEILKQINDRLGRYEEKYQERVGRFDKIEIMKEEDLQMSEEKWNKVKYQLEKKFLRKVTSLYAGNVFEKESLDEKTEEILRIQYEAAGEVNDTSTPWLSYLDQHVDPEFNKCFHKATDKIKIELAARLFQFRLQVAAGRYWKLRQAGKKIWQIIKSDNITTVYQLYRRAEKLRREGQLCEATLFFDLTAALALKVEDETMTRLVSILCLRPLSIINHQLHETGGDERLIVYTYAMRVLEEVCDILVQRKNALEKL